MNKKLISSSTIILNDFIDKADKAQVSNTPEYQKLQQTGPAYKAQGMRSILSQQGRAAGLNFSSNNVHIDFSRQFINDEILDQLAALGERRKMKYWINGMFTGQKINATENRAVLHIALRNVSYDKETGLFSALSEIYVDGKDVMPEVVKELNKMAELANQINSGTYRGYTDKTVKDIYVLGVGGSLLGPEFLHKALSRFQVNKDINFHFSGTQDTTKLTDELAGKNADECLFLIMSKTFTTGETMSNANRAREWFLEKTDDNKEAISKHFIAISTALDKVKDFGIDPDKAIAFWDWVGGRFSIHSAIGTANMIQIGPENFAEFLRGSHDMDEHFRTTPLRENIPFLKGAVQFYNNNVLGYSSYMQVPYASHLGLLTPYNQQDQMESNGKSTDIFGRPLDVSSGPVYFGNTGPEDQHAYFQQEHQGSTPSAVELIGVLNSADGNSTDQRDLINQMVSQAKAFALGKSRDQLVAQGVPENLIPFKLFAGDRPTTLTWIKDISPYSIGALVTMNQHKVFTEGVLTGIFSFDQWGVELGKEMDKAGRGEIESGGIVLKNHDDATATTYKMLNEELPEMFPVR